MMRVIAFNLAKIGEDDAHFFRALHDAFAAYGAGMRLFSANNSDLIRSFRLNFTWTIQHLTQMHSLPASTALRHRLTDAQRAVWTERVACLALQDHSGPPGALVDILERFANFVLTTLKPDLILSWNTLCPHSGVLADIARDIGIPVFMMERSFLQNSWFLERGGLVGHSSVTGVDFDHLVGAEAAMLRDLGRSYLASDPFRSMSRYAQQHTDRFVERLQARRRTGRPIIGFFPPDDLSLGFLPADGEDRRRHLPQHSTSLEAAVALAQAAPDCDVIFKPHPSFRELTLPDQVTTNLFVINHDYREVIAQSDIVASTGSGLVVQAMAAGKPVLSLGNDQFTGKTITYDAQHDIRPALDAALRREELPRRMERFETLIGYALRHYLVSGPAADPAFRRPKEAVAEIMATEFPDHSVHTPTKAPADAAPPGTLRDRQLLFQRLDSLAMDGGSGGGHVVVDFDHTLLLANSTELLLDHVRPRFIFAGVHWMLSWLAPWKGWESKGLPRHALFDPLRIVLTLLCAPWLLLSWQIAGPRLARRHANAVLAERLRRLDPARIAIVSNGHPWIIGPMLRGLGLGPVKLICDTVLPGPRSIRRQGKLATCRRRMRDFDPDKSVVITDSLDDADLLAVVRTAFLIDWGDARNKADPLAAYFPFVLTSEGKYPGARVVRRHRFQEDLPVILCAFALSGLPGFSAGPEAILAALGTALACGAALLMFFLSFNAVYEIGYWDNDFVAASTEQQPNVSPRMERFRRYPIHRQAWIWGIVLGAAGSILAAALAGSALSLPAALAELPLPGPLVGLPVGETAMLAALVFGLWACVLVLSRLLFRAHNAVGEVQRIYTFWLLHFGKLAAFGAIFATNPAGLVLMVAQVFRHWAHYLIYRFKGDKAAAPKYEIRAFFFLFLTAAMMMVLPAMDILTPNWFLGALLFLFRSEYWRFVPRRSMPAAPSEASAVAATA